MVADGRHHIAHLLGRYSHGGEQLEGHDGAGLGMIGPVDHIADVVQEAGNAGQFHGALIVAQGSEDLGGAFCHLGHMAEGVLGVAHGSQVVVGAADVFPDGFIVLDAFKCNWFQMKSVLLSCCMAALCYDKNPGPQPGEQGPARGRNSPVNPIITVRNSFAQRVLSTVTQSSHKSSPHWEYWKGMD